MQTRIVTKNSAKEGNYHHQYGYHHSHTLMNTNSWLPKEQELKHHHTHTIAVANNWTHELWTYHIRISIDRKQFYFNKLTIKNQHEKWARRKTYPHKYHCMWPTNRWSIITVFGWLFLIALNDNFPRNLNFT